MSLGKTPWISAAAALALSAACAGLREAPPIGPGRVHKIAVLPFSGDAPGPACSDELARALAARGFEIVPADVVARVFSELGIAKENSIGEEALEAAHRRTGADAIVFGAVACPKSGAGSVRFVMLDALIGETLLQGTSKLKRCRAPEAAAEGTKAMLDAMARLWEKSRWEGNTLGDELGGGVN